MTDSEEVAREAESIVLACRNGKLKECGAEIDAAKLRLSDAGWSSDRIEEVVRMSIEGLFNFGLGENILPARTDQASRSLPMTRMNEALNMIGRKEYDVALECLLWCYDSGLDHDPYFDCVQTTFLIAYLVELAKLFPIAVPELEKRARMSITESHPLRRAFLELRRRELIRVFESSFWNVSNT